MSSLEKAIVHYKKVAKEAVGTRASYALGALEVLEKVKGLRDEYRSSARRIWRDRGNPNIANLYYQQCEVANSLDNLMITEAG